MKSEFLSIFKERGFFHQATDESGLDALLASSAAAYIGFDCTAPSLHVGSLMQIMALRLLQKTGHKPIILMGGGTTKVGDPSGKDESRKLLSDAEIEANKKGISGVFGKFLDLSRAVTVDNSEWLSGLSYIEFLRDYGRHFSVNRMLSFDSVKLRLEREQNLSFLEFNYMIFQAYDFVELQRRHGCRVQIGGSDQWGNIVNGVELARRLGGAELFGLTTPLITTSSGAKMGKTASGAVWLDSALLPPYGYFQFWRNAEDADTGRFLRLFTDLPPGEIKRLEALEGQEINEAKKILAFEATALCHGQQAAEEAQETARKTFEEGASGDSLPTISVSRAELEAGIPAYQLFHKAGLAASGGEAKKLIRGGGARINGSVIENESLPITSSSLESGQLKLSAGKKRHVVVKEG